MKKSQRRALFPLLALGIFLLVAMGGKPEPERPPMPAAQSTEVAQAPAEAPILLAAAETKASAPVSPPSYVKGISIKDREALDGKKPIVVTFSEPMVAPEAVNVEVAEADRPFVLSPPAFGEGHWLTTNSFAFLPEKEFRRGIRYFLHLKEGLVSLKGEPVKYLFSFRTEGVKLDAVQVERFNSKKNTLVLGFSFDESVSSQAFAEHLAVLDADSGEPLPYKLRREGGRGSDHSVQIALGKYRPKIKVVVRGDADDDDSYLGLVAEQTRTVVLPAPDSDQEVATVEARTDAVSDVHFRYRYSSEDSEGNLYAFFDLSESLHGGNYKDFIKVTPDLPYTLDEAGDRLEFRQGLEPGMRIRVTLKPGLVDVSGKPLQEERRDSVIVRSYRPAARFAHHGSYLTPAYGGRLGVDIVNVDQITVSLKRQYDNNLPFMNLDPSYEARQIMRDLSFKEIPIKGHKKDVIQRRALDVAALAKGKQGVFLLTLNAYVRKTNNRGETYMDFQRSQDQLVILTDIGVTARTYPAGISVFASSLSTARPLAGAEVRVYSASNQIVAEGRTDSDGLFIHQRNEAWDPQLQPNVVTVKHGQGDGADLSFLPLESVTSKEMADSALRPYLDKGYEAFVYTPRGVFRPGETVDIKAFVRDANHQSPAPFPVLFRVLSSRGLEAARGSATLSAEGGADFAFTLPRTSPSGEYQVSVQIPGQKDSTLGSCSFSVEDFVPPRLEVAVSPKSDRLSMAENLPVSLSGQYLFGAPGADLRYELGYRVSPAPFVPEGWDGYVFGDMERKFDSQMNLKYLSGKLQSNGLADVLFKAPTDWLPPALLKVLLVASVQEDGGRWVSQTNTVTYFPTPYLLGLKAEGTVFQSGSPVSMKVAAVDADGKQTASGRLKAEISLIQGNWHTLYRNGRYVYMWDERMIMQETMPVDATKGMASFQFTPKRSGRYLVRVVTEDGVIAASRRLLASGEGAPGDDGSGRLDSVELRFDKPDYRVGDVAKLSIKAPYAGTLLLGVERGSQLSSRVIAMETPSLVVDIPVTEGMDPNASVTAWVIRPVREENKEWYAHRACGMAPLLLSKEPHTLAVSVSAPPRATPEKSLAVPFSVVDEHGAPVEGEFSVAFIDEGILSLTAFATPDPVSYFMARRRAVGNSYDAYDALLRPEVRATPLLTPGGDAAAAYQGSLSTQQIFLTAYLPVVRTDANGQGEAVFDIPEYSGKGRLMIVGASRDRFATSSTEIRVARDVVLEASAPRAVAPGDLFELSLKLFTLPGEGGTALQGNAELSVKAEGPLALSGDLQKSFPLGGNSDAQGRAAGSHALTLKAEALQQSGVGRIEISVRVPGREDLAFSKKLEVVVRPPYPRSSAVTTALLKGGESSTMQLPGPWLKGSVKAAFSIDRSPVLAVLPALEYLREYPYGCLEQVTSRAWPYLTMNSIQAALYPEADKAAAGDNAKAALADIVGRIASMQTPDGGFALWPGQGVSDPWKSVNATFFLVEAKKGTAVPQSTLDNAFGYLNMLLAAPVRESGREAYDYSTKAYAAFVLTRAGKAPLGWIQHLSEHERKMYPSGRIFLAGAKAVKAGNANALAALSGKGQAFADMPSKRIQRNDSMESELRNKSLRLLMWSLVAPGDPETSRLCASVAELLGKGGGRTPQEAGMAALALGRYLEKTGITSGRYKANIAASGNSLATITDGRRVVLGADRLPLSADGQPPVISVSMGDQKAQAYAVYSVRGVPAKAPEPVSSELAVQRVWKDAQGKVIDLSSGSAKVEKGDRILVELTVKPVAPLSHIALSDLLPGGMEVENPRLKTAAGAVDDGNSDDDDDDDDEYSEDTRDGLYLDLREDRLLVFFDRLERETTYRYSLRAVSRGTFVLPPLAADGMYDPAVRAITATGTIIVE